MILGIAILYQIPRKAAPSTFSFMAPLGTEVYFTIFFPNRYETNIMCFQKKLLKVWILLGATYIFVSICFYCLGRLSPSQWENPYPCVEEPAYLENQFSFQNALWFAAGGFYSKDITDEFVSITFMIFFLM